MNTIWHPTTTQTALHRRAEIFDTIRKFFREREVLEVETPLLSANTVTDPHLASFHTDYQISDQTAQTLYLQTSPEFAMKRLLAAGSGPIYQITRAFRNQGEQGRWHNPEFTLLEWYRPGFNLEALMHEAQALLQLILDDFTVERLTYRELFEKYLGLDPHKATLTQIRKVLSSLSIQLQPTHWLTDCDTGLQLIIDHLIQYYINKNHLLFLYNFPVSQAALARIHPGSPPVAARVEIYYRGIELANGFDELTDAVEQKQRFLKDLAIRKKQKLPPLVLDEKFIAALAHGLPQCSGMAMGLDRLIALAMNYDNLEAVISFPIARA